MAEHFNTNLWNLRNKKGKQHAELVTTNFQQRFLNVSLINSSNLFSESHTMDHNQRYHTTKYSITFFTFSTQASNGKTFSHAEEKFRGKLCITTTIAGARMEVIRYCSSPQLMFSTKKGNWIFPSSTVTAPIPLLKRG